MLDENIRLKQRVNELETELSEVANYFGKRALELFSTTEVIRDEHERKTDIELKPVSTSVPVNYFGDLPYNELTEIVNAIADRLATSIVNQIFADIVYKEIKPTSLYQQINRYAPK